MRWVTVTLAIVLGCGAGDLRSGEGESGVAWSLSLEPPVPLDEAPPVVALVLTGALSDNPADPILAEGIPSKVSINRYGQGVTTEALADRIVPTLVEARNNGFAMRPKNILALGQSYSVLTRFGLLGTIHVRPQSDPTYLVRAWPPRESVEPTLQTVYCGSRAPTEAMTIALFPSENGATLVPGLDQAGFASGQCVRIVLGVTGNGTVLPPTDLGEYSIDPSPWISGAELPEIEPLDCTETELRFGPACLTLESGRASVRTPATTTWWAMRGSLGWHTQSAVGNSRFIIPNVGLSSEERLEAVVFDLAGRSFSTDITLIPPVATGRVVINEVMANPLGAEPGEEWVELLNDGQGPVDLVDWHLRDQAGESAIPALRLEPFAIVLLVRNDFVGGLEGDVPPAPNTTLARMASLGKNGLANSGEVLSLVDSKGRIVSSFPALSSERAGVSLARRNPAGLDEDPGAFGEHQSPGASPGAPNLVE